MRYEGYHSLSTSRIATRPPLQIVFVILINAVRYVENTSVLEFSDHGHNELVGITIDSRGVEHLPDHVNTIFDHIK